MPKNQNIEIYAVGIKITLLGTDQVSRIFILEELELKVEHEGSHTSFFNLDVRVEKGLFIYIISCMKRETTVNIIPS